jgi:hypothetical protein
MSMVLTHPNFVQELAIHLDKVQYIRDVFHLLLVNKSFNKAWKRHFKRLASMWKLSRKIFTPRYRLSENFDQLEELRVSNYVILNDTVIGNIETISFGYRYKTTTYLKNDPKVEEGSEHVYLGCKFTIEEVVHVETANEYHVISSPTAYTRDKGRYMYVTIPYQCKLDAVDQCKAVYHYFN